MKKIIALIAVMLSLAGCSQSRADPVNRMAISIADSVTEIKITHIIHGTETHWTANGDELETLKNWTSELNCNMIQFEEAQSPDDEDGGEIYHFSYEGCGASRLFLRNQWSR